MCCHIFIGFQFYDYYDFICKPSDRNGHISAPFRRRCRSYNAPAQAALHRVRSLTFFAHPPPLLYRVTERISGFGSRRYLALPARPPRGSHQVWVTNLATASFRSLIGSHKPLFPPRAAHESFFGHPCFHLHVASFQGPWPDLHQLVSDHAGHTWVPLALHPPYILIYQSRNRCNHRNQ